MKTVHALPGSYDNRALFSIRSCSLFNFWLYSRSLISHTFFMMEALQPTVSLFFSPDIFRLIQTSCTWRETEMDFHNKTKTKNKKHCIYLKTLLLCAEPSGGCEPQRRCPLRWSSHCTQLCSNILLPSVSLTLLLDAKGLSSRKYDTFQPCSSNHAPKITFRDRSKSWWRLRHASEGKRGMKGC